MSGEDHKTDLFLSHDWGEDGRTNHAKVSKINDALKHLGYVTWFDNERMTGDIRGQMAFGIENTKCFVAFITKNYHEKVVNGSQSDNCRLEFNYASSTVPLIAVVVDKSMKNTQNWKGNIGLSLKSKLYVDLSGNIENKKYLEQQLKLLGKELKALGIAPKTKGNTTTSLSSSSSSSSSSSKENSTVAKENPAAKRTDDDSLYKLLKGQIPLLGLTDEQALRHEEYLKKLHLSKEI